MSQAAPYTGRPVSEGTAAGLLHQADPGPPADATAGQVRAAFAAVAADRHDLAERLRVAGRAAEADIIGVAALIAADPALVGPAVTAVAAGTDAATAVAGAAEAQAAVLSGLAVPELAERAGDVRQIAQAVLGRLAAAGAPPRPDGAFILVRREVSPADLIEYAEDGLAGAVSVAGGGSTNAAIVARGLGLPMITGVDAAVLAEPDGQHAVLDAVAGELRIGPAAGAGLVAGGSAIAGGSATGADGTAAGAAPAAGSGPAAMAGNGRRQARYAGPAATADGHEITVLCNVASAAETRTGLAHGATGVGLLRTEIPFTEALAWPTLAEHRAHLAPILGLLAGRTVTVRPASRPRIGARCARCSASVGQASASVNGISVRSRPTPVAPWASPVLVSAADATLHSTVISWPSAVAAGPAYRACRRPFPAMAAGPLPAAGAAPAAVPSAPVTLPPAIALPPATALPSATALPPATRPAPAAGPILSSPATASSTACCPSGSASSGTASPDSTAAWASAAPATAVAASVPAATAVTAGPTSAGSAAMRAATPMMSASAARPATRNRSAKS